MATTTSDTLKRAKRAFDDRADWESLWDTVYSFVAPERDTFFITQRTASEVADEIFDSTAIDAAERLANLIVSGLTPPWTKWMRFEPGPAVPEEQVEDLRKLYKQWEDQLFARVQFSGYYGEIHPALLDRIVGGTGALVWFPGQAPTFLSRFKCAPLSGIAIQEDQMGRATFASYRWEWRLEDIDRSYSNKLPADLKRELTSNPRAKDEKKKVYLVSTRQADGSWDNRTILEWADGVELSKLVAPHPQVLPTRWSKVPGMVYGRGPGLRALSDVRALNKLKELVLKNAAKAVSGVYTGVADGVLNPLTVDFEPGAIIPVASNDLNSPSLAELPNTARFDVGAFQMSELSTAIRSTFMLDQFGDLERTPRSATEVAERSRILAHDLGATISRLQDELLIPVVSIILSDMKRAGLVPQEVVIDGLQTDLMFLSRLAQGQVIDEENQILSYASVVTQFGQIDPKAGLVYDVFKGLRRLGKLKGIHPDDMRTDEQIQEKMQEAATAMAGLQGQGGEEGQQNV